MFGIFMILLTQQGGGPINGAFAVQESLAECEHKLPAVVYTIEASGHDVLRSGCVQGDWPFAAFSHGAESESERYHYLVDFSRGAAPTIRPMASATACERSLGGGASAQPRYCATSRQSWAR